MDGHPGGRDGGGGKTNPTTATRTMDWNLASSIRPLLSSVVTTVSIPRRHSFNAILFGLPFWSLFLVARHFSSHLRSTLPRSPWRSGAAMNTLVNHVRARARSIQLEKGINSSTDSPTCGSYRRPGRRRGILALGPENIVPSANYECPATIRRYRSMIYVEEPPKIRTPEPMSYDELYPAPPESPPQPEETMQPRRRRTTENSSWMSSDHFKETSQDSTSLNFPLPLASPILALHALNCHSYLC